jgi:hypothetical protein
MQWAMEDEAAQRTADGVKLTVIAYDATEEEHVLLEQVIRAGDVSVYKQQWRFDYPVKKLRFLNDTLATERHDKLWCLPEIVLPE